MIFCDSGTGDVAPCALAAGAGFASTTPQRTSATVRKSAEVLLHVIERNFQRLQKAHVLRRHFKLGRLAILMQNFLVDLNVQ